MSKSQNHGRFGLLCLGLLLAAAGTGCQSDVGGQTLPSPYWQTDDIQYFAPGTEFKLSREAAAMEAAKRDIPLGGQPGPAPMPLGPGAPAAGPIPTAPGVVGPAPAMP